MSIKEVTYYQGFCDWPGGCDAELHYEYTAWGDSSSVLDEVRDADWWQSKGDEKTFHVTIVDQQVRRDGTNSVILMGCPDGGMIVAVDDPFDDGTVTLIAAASDPTEVETVDLVAALRASIEAAKARRAASERRAAGDPR